MSDKTSGFKQALWLGISQAMGMALAFVSSAILSRYFDKDAYGTYKQVIYVYSTLFTVFTAGLPGVFAYFIPRLSQGQGKTLVNKITGIFFLLGLLFSLILYFSSDLIAEILENPELSFAIKVFSPFPLFTIPTMGVEGIYTALKKTKYIAGYQFISKTAMLVCIVTPVIFFHGGYIYAIIGWGIASFITFLVAMWMKQRPYIGIKKELVPGMYKTVFNYSIPMMASSLVGMVLHSGNQFFISRFYGTEAFANFSNGFIPIPIIGMVAGSVKSVLLPMFSKAQSEDKIEEAVATYHNAVYQCVTLLFPILVFCMFYAKDIVTFLFSSKYSDSTLYLQISTFKDFIEVFPYFALLLSFAKTKVYFNIHVIATLFLWIMDGIVVWFNLGPYYIAATSSLIQILIVLTGLFYIQVKLKVKIINKSELLKCIKILITAIIICFISRLIIIFIPLNNNPLLALILGFVIFYSLVVVSGKIMMIDYLQTIKKLVKQ